MLSTHGGTERVEIQDVHGKIDGRKGRGQVDGRRRLFLPVQHRDMAPARELPDDVPSEASGSPGDEHLVESHLILWRSRDPGGK